MKEKRVDLAIGVGSELSIQIEGMEERFKAVMVGMDPPNYLLVRMLLTSKFQGQIDHGTSFIVRYIYMGNVYGFRSISLGSTMSPYKITFLSYPKSIEVFNLRKAQRASCFIPAVAVLKDNDLHGVIIDISREGARFTINTGTDQVINIKVEDKVALSFPLLGIEGMQKFQGKIMNVKRDAVNLSFGIQFKNIDAVIAEKIDGYVKDVLDYQSE